jgi:hypothetical protein
MGRTASTEPQYLYSRAIPLLPLWAVRPVQSLRACTRVSFTLNRYQRFERPYWLQLLILSVFAWHFGTHIPDRTVLLYVYSVVSFPFVYSSKTDRTFYLQLVCVPMYRALSMHMMAYVWSGNIAPLNLNLGSRWRWSARRLGCCGPGRSPSGALWIGGWLGHRMFEWWRGQMMMMMMMKFINCNRVVTRWQ